MEIKATKEFWNIYYNGTIQNKILRQQISHKVEIGMANYKRRIFYEYYKNGAHHIYTFYRFDDINNEIIEIANDGFNHKPIFYPKFGYFILRGYYNDQWDLYTIYDYGLHFYRALTYRMSKIVCVGEKNIIFKVANSCYIYDIKIGTCTSFDPNTFSITDNNIYVKLKNRFYQFYNYDFLTFGQKLILKIPSTTTVTNDGTIIKDGLTYEVNIDGTLQRTEMIDYDRLLFPLSKERFKIEMFALVDKLVPCYKVLLDTIKSYT